MQTSESFNLFSRININSDIVSNLKILAHGWYGQCRNKEECGSGCDQRSGHHPGSFYHAQETYVRVEPTSINLWYWYALNISWSAVHYFHMALFVFISGYLACGKLNAKFLLRTILTANTIYVIWTLFIISLSLSLDSPDKG